MKKYKLGKIFAALLFFGTVFSFSAYKVQAGYLSGNAYASTAKKYVRVTKAMPVYRCRTGRYEAENNFYKAGKVKKGTKLYISNWLMSTGSCWVIKNKKYYHNRRTFFVVRGNENTKWYKRIY